MTAGLAAIMALMCVDAEAQRLKNEEIIGKATAYVRRFVSVLTNVVAEERYEQETLSPRDNRVLTAEFLLVRLPGEALWQVLRDVADVDGKPVANREERVMKLLTEPASSSWARAWDLAAAGARHNLVDVGTLDNPILALAFLQDYYVDRFRFTVAGIDRSVGPTARVVRFVEYQTPTIIKGNANADIPSRGLYWIDERTGSVLKTELQLGASRSPIRITTSFGADDALDINVPTEMRIRYPRTRMGEYRGKATYGRFRRFQVRTSEALQR